MENVETTIKVDHVLKHEFCKNIADARYKLLLLDLPTKEFTNIYTRLDAVLETVLNFDEEGEECECEEDNPLTKQITVFDAVEALSNGHGIVRPSFATKVCELCGVQYSKSLQHHMYSDWKDPKGLRMEEGYEGAICVSTLSLSAHVARELGVIDEAEGKLGRGFQAREYTRVIVKKLRENGTLPEKEEK